MKLTVSMKNSLVASIFGDVPRVDYTAEIEQIIRKTAFGILPPEIRSLPKDTIDNFVVSEAYYRTEIAQSLYLPTGKERVTLKILNAQLKENSRFTELCALHNAQEEMLYGIRCEITKALNSCNTDKQLLARYPEFAKSLPTQNEISNLPTVPIIEHLKAAGWKE